MQSLMRDIRFASRSLRKSPGLTIVATLVLAFGIGLTTTMFSIVYDAMIRGLPYPDGDRIVRITRANPGRGIRNSSLPIQDFLDFRAHQRSFSGVGAFTSGTMYVSGDEKAEGFGGSWISANLFDLVGVQPMLGRNFRKGEDTPTGDRVVILSYNLWHNRYGADPRILDKTIHVNGVVCAVVGVMPDGFTFPNRDALWVPLQTDPLATMRGKGSYVQVAGKLTPGISIGQANLDVAAIAKRLASEYPDSNEGFTASVEPFIDRYIGPVRPLLLTMLGAVLFVLLIACANVANLLLDRATHRIREVGIRTALGASRSAVIRQFLAESLVLSLAATAFGVVVASLGIAAFNRALASMGPPFFIDIRLYPQVLLFTIAMAGLTTLTSGAIPAIQSSGADIHEVLKDESRGASSFRIGKISRALVMFEIALSCALLVAAGLMIKSAANMRNMDPGFTAANVFTARVGFPASYTDTLAQWRFFDQARDGVTALPGVQVAALSSGLPAGQGLGSSPFAIEGQQYLEDKDYPTATTSSVTARFFETLRIPIASGRSFGDDDGPGSPPVAIVNRAFVNQYLRQGDPIGRRIRLGDGKSTEPWITIVGTVGNTFNGDMTNPMSPAIFRPFAQQRRSFVYISARTASAPLAIAQAVRGVVARLNPDIPLFEVQTLDEGVTKSLSFPRLFGTMFVILGVAALLLASVGLYAVMSFSVSRRRREVGIRMALGAQRHRVMAMIVGQGLIQLGIGMSIGFAMALGLSQLLTFILFQLQPRDPVIFGGVAVVLVMVGLIACLVPAKRATLVDPLVALRTE